MLGTPSRAKAKAATQSGLARYCVDRDEGKAEADVEHSHIVNIHIGGRAEAPKRKAIESAVISEERKALHRELMVAAVAAGMIEEFKE